MGRVDAQYTAVSRNYRDFSGFDADGFVSSPGFASAFPARVPVSSGEQSEFQQDDW
jgi:hypothetical protein